MLQPIIEIGTAIFAMVYTFKIRRPKIQAITVLMALSMLLHYDTLLGLSQFSNYIFAFMSMVAAAESFNSINLKYSHKTFFVLTALLIVLIEIEHTINMPVHIESTFLVLVYLIVFVYFYFTDKKKVKTRLAILILWLAYFIQWF